MSIAVVPYTLRHHAFNLEQVKTIYSTLHELGYDGLENGMGRSAGLSPEEDLELIRSNGLPPLSFILTGREAGRYPRSGPG